MMLPSTQLCLSFMGYMLPPLTILKSFGFEPENTLDIGAAHGHFAVMIRTVWPQTKLVCVEGNKECQCFLRSLQNGEVFYELLGEVEHVRDFYMTKMDAVSGGNSYYLEKTPAFDEANLIKQKRQVRTLDTLLPGRQFDLVKIDTQGSELDILKGGYSILGKAKVVILEVALCEYNRGAPLFDQVAKFMQDHGFLVFDMVGPINGGHFWGERKNQVDVVWVNRDYQEWFLNP